MTSSGQVVGAIETSHQAGVHDAQLDYYGKRLATASGDHSVHVFDLGPDGQQRPAGELKSHEGPVWKISWAHPRFGSLLASCSYDMRVIIWKEMQPSHWQIAYMDQSHVASVNSVEFCPAENGLRLACASSDGTVSVLTYAPQEAGWRRAAFQAHGNGAQCLSWAPPSFRDGAVVPTMRLATGGSDFRVVVWRCENESWAEESSLYNSDGHTDWIRAVAWRPTGPSVIASGGWDKSVIVWTQEMEGRPWRLVCKLTLPNKVENLSWTVTGSTLSVTTCENETYLYREAYDGRFEQVASVNETGLIDLAPSHTAVLDASPSAAAGWGQTVSPEKHAVPQQSDLHQQQQQAVLDSFGL